LLKKYFLQRVVYISAGKMKNEKNGKGKEKRKRKIKFYQ